MIIRDPCRKCLVRAACQTICEDKVSFYTNRDKPFTWFIIGVDGISFIIWATLVYRFPVLNNKTSALIYVLCILGFTVATIKFFMYDMKDFTKRKGK